LNTSSNPCKHLAVIFLHPWGVKTPSWETTPPPHFFCFLIIFIGFRCNFAHQACLHPPKYLNTPPPNFQFLEIALHSKHKTADMLKVHILNFELDVKLHSMDRQQSNPLYCYCQYKWRNYPLIVYTRRSESFVFSGLQTNATGCLHQNQFLNQFSHNSLDQISVTHLSVSNKCVS